VSATIPSPERGTTIQGETRLSTFMLEGSRGGT